MMQVIETEVRWRSEICILGTGAQSPYRPLYRALANAGPKIDKVVSITQRREIEHAARHGDWTVSTDSDGVQSISAPEPDEVKRLISESDRQRHIFLDMHWYPVISRVRRAGGKHGAISASMSESGAGGRRGSAGAPSLGDGSSARRHAKFVLAIRAPRTGVVSRAGYGNRVFNFAYFLKAPNEIAAHPADAGSRTKVASSGAPRIKASTCCWMRSRC